MQSLILTLKQVGLRVVSVIFLVLLTWVWGGNFSAFNSTIVWAESLTPEAEAFQVKDELKSPASLEKAAETAEKASEKVFDQMEKTQDVVGKTEGRKEAIKTAREHASNKLKSQAERAKSAAQNSDDLPYQEKLYIKGLQGEN